MLTNTHVNGADLYHNLARLRSNVAGALKFSPDIAFVLTYTDKDGDKVMLDDKNNLCDARITQQSQNVFSSQSFSLVFPNLILGL
jgi:next to BRCA1 gene 1 protein